MSMLKLRLEWLERIHIFVNWRAERRWHPQKKKKKTLFFFLLKLYYNKLTCFLTIFRQYELFQSLLLMETHRNTVEQSEEEDKWMNRKKKMRELYSFYIDGRTVVVCLCLCVYGRFFFALDRMRSLFSIIFLALTKESCIQAYCSFRMNIAITETNESTQLKLRRFFFCAVVRYPVSQWMHYTPSEWVSERKNKIPIRLDSVRFGSVPSLIARYWCCCNLFFFLLFFYFFSFFLFIIFIHPFILFNSIHSSFHFTFYEDCTIEILLKSKAKKYIWLSNFPLFICSNAPTRFFDWFSRLISHCVNTYHKQAHTLCSTTEMGKDNDI